MTATLAHRALQRIGGKEQVVARCLFTFAGNQTRFSKVLARAERMLAIAPFIAIDLDALEATRRHLAQHEAEVDAAVESSKRKELERLMSDDIAELCRAYTMIERTVGRGGEA